MNALIPVIIGLLIVGCGEEIPTTKARKKELTPKEKAAIAEKTFRDSFVGTYERKDEDGISYKRVFLANGVYEQYLAGSKFLDGTWKIVGKEVHIEFLINFLDQKLCKVEPNGDLTDIAKIKEGIRTDVPKEEQFTYKKIK